MSLRSADLASGRISEGITPNRSIEATIEFVASQLAGWRDEPGRPSRTGEVPLNATLCKYLNRAAGRSFYMIEFCHDEPDAQGMRPDISVSSHEEITIGARKFSLFEPFLWMEGKRLPPPDNRREREYVIGVTKPIGGIQRFKLGLHGELHSVAVLIGYIQSGDIAHWRKSINKWIKDLSMAKSSADCKWAAKEILSKAKVDKASRVGQLSSSHARAKGKCKGPIKLVHLWVVM